MNERKNDKIIDITICKATKVISVVCESVDLTEMGDVGSQRLCGVTEMSIRLYNTRTCFIESST